MKKNSLIQGYIQTELNPFTDERGCFLKVFQQSLVGGSPPFQPKECFYTSSKRGVVRGLHFQAPPKAHDKIVVCLSGKAFDVVLDLRSGSDSYGRFETCVLDASTPSGLFIPKGCAHGFQALEENTTLLYLTDEEYDAYTDQGILWNSLEGLNWPLAEPVLSSRDQKFPPWQKFESPF